MPELLTLLHRFSELYSLDILLYFSESQEIPVSRAETWLKVAISGVYDRLVGANGVVYGEVCREVCTEGVQGEVQGEVQYTAIPVYTRLYSSIPVNTRHFP